LDDNSETEEKSPFTIGNAQEGKAEDADKLIGGASGQELGWETSD
jgi:hypothetical protein